MTAVALHLSTSCGKVKLTQAEYDRKPPITACLTARYAFLRLDSRRSGC
jgi:hypothetical protein